MRILVVDDSKNIRVVLKHLLTRWGHEVMVANDGQEAWDLLQTESVPLVISDWMMPGMTGPELCRKLRDADFPVYTYVILLTARSQTGDIVQGMEAGADDFVVKPFNNDELKVRIRAAERIVALQGDLAERNERLEEVNQELGHAYDAISRDLEAAAKIQKGLLPESASCIQGVKFDWLFCPAAFVAGDAFNVLQIDDEHIAFYHLDVTGHGVPAAMLSYTLSKLLSPKHQLLQSVANGEDLMAPADVVTSLNERFQDDACGFLYFTAIYGTLNTRTGKGAFCQAGHPNPLYQGKTAWPELLGSGGFPVGMLPDISYDSVEFELNSGDRLMLYSDGVTECMRQGDQAWGDDRLIAFVEDQRESDLHAVMTGLKEQLCDWRGDEQFDDDVSVLMLERM